MRCDGDWQASSHVRERDSYHEGSLVSMVFKGRLLWIPAASSRRALNGAVFVCPSALENKYKQYFHDRFPNKIFRFYSQFFINFKLKFLLCSYLSVYSEKASFRTVLTSHVLNRVKLFKTLFSAINVVVWVLKVCLLSVVNTFYFNSTKCKWEKGVFVVMWYCSWKTYRLLLAGILIRWVS